MIERIRVKNFQCHKKLEIVFSDTTTITGKSDAGKSAVIRALRWVATNEPNGDTFVRHGAGECAVEVVVDGHVVLRRRGKGVNTYSLDGKLFKAFGNKVPEPIANLFNLQPLNFQSQHDPAFWFTLPATHVAKELNQIVNLEQIDSSQSKANLTVSRLAQQVRTYQANQAEEATEAARLSWVADAVADNTRLQALKTGARTKALNASLSGSALETASKQALALENALERRKWAFNGLRTLQTVHKAVSAWKTADMAVALALQWDRLTEKAHERRVLGLSRLQYTQAKQTANQARKALDEWQRNEQQKRQAQQAAAEATERLRVLGVCPTCLQPLS